jgi:hypothetical protein
MKIPSEPPIGSLIAYEYFWYSQAAKREDGEKTYPTALILAKSWEFSSTLVHRQAGVCWKCRRNDEVNIFVWPGPDFAAGKLSFPPSCKRR